MINGPDGGPPGPATGNYRLGGTPMVAQVRRLSIRNDT
jgi:hypothetical protein